MEDALHVVCPSCRAVNRVPEERRNENPKCGKCGAPILEPKPIDLDEFGMQQQVEKSTLPLVVDFYAPWCGHCRQMAPYFDEAAKRLHTEALLAKVDTEKDQALAGRMGIRSIPTLVMFKEGKESARVSGVLKPEEIVRWVQENA